MKLHVIDAGNFKLDGGAMFGVVPKTLWSKQIPADDLNLCSWKMRCLLIEHGKQLVLIDTGMGHKQDARWQGFYYRHGETDLLGSIRKAGFEPTDVTDVILSHLHFDHCGGAVQWNASRDGYEPTFANARYWTASGQWQLAMQPNAREKATFLTENIMPLSDRGVLHYLDQQEVWPFEFMDIRYAFGHTEQMMLPVVNYVGKKVIFMADLVPSHAHLPVPWVMGYDTQPLQSMVEKEALLKEAAAQQYVLYFDHDPFFDCCTVQQTERGIRVLESGRLSDFI